MPGMLESHCRKAARTSVAGHGAAWLLAAVVTGTALGGCGSSRPNGRFDVSARPDSPAADYRVFYLAETADDRSSMSEQERREQMYLDNLRIALVDELKERGYQVTSRAMDPDVDAMVTYGYSVQGERGTNYSHQPGQAFTSNGQTFVTPGYTTAMPYAREDHTVWVRIHDAAEVRSARGELGRIREVWKGQLGLWANDVDGLQPEEARKMAMNLLSDFPNALQTGNSRREVFDLAERAAMVTTRDSVPSGETKVTSGLAAQ